MSQNKRCFVGLHQYEVYKEVEVIKQQEDSKAVVVGINIVSRCSNCGKVTTKFVATDSDYLNNYCR